MGHPGPLSAPVEVLDSDVPPGFLRARAEVMEDDLVLPGHQTAQAEGRVSTTVEEGDNEGHIGPLLGPAVLYEPTGPRVPQGWRMLHLPGAPPTCDVLASRRQLGPSLQWPSWGRRAPGAGSDE